MSDGVLIDINLVLDSQPTGIGVYIRELISRFPSLPTNGFDYGYYYQRNRRDYTQFLASRVPQAQMKDAFHRGLSYYKGTKYFDLSIGRSATFSMDVQILSLLSCGNWRVFHGTSLPAVTWFPTMPRRVKGIITVHDLAFLHSHTPPPSLACRQRWTRRVGDAVRRADRVIADSQAAADEIQEYYKVDPNKLQVVYLGVDEQEISWIDAAEKSAFRHRWNLPERFLLFVGTVCERKNVLNAIKAFMSIDDPDLGFVVIGNPEPQHTSEIEAYLRQCPRREKVRMCGYLERQDVEAFYQLATAFVFPSVYEGFGLPVLEAMKRRLPVVTSNQSCLQELFHDSAILVDPLDPDDIARGMKQVLEDESTRAALIEKGLRKARTFTWQNTAEQTMAVYRSVL